MDRKSFMRGTLVGVLAMCLIFGAVFSGIKLFERFYTVENADKNSAGLGLSIVQSFAEKMNCPINADYVEGKLVIEIEF